MSVTDKKQRRAIMKAGMKARGKNIMAKRAATRKAAMPKAVARKVTPTNKTTPIKSSATTNRTINRMGTVAIPKTTSTSKRDPIKKTTGISGVSSGKRLLTKVSGFGKRRKMRIQPGKKYKVTGIR